ncbi:matrixin family metalloprotease [Halarcobacter ebronensis]|uniref:Peptidase M10 metallopeptidase domain-containing protein n=1 Tax=Halarcobacter ebronensis TaxID=1462615 RepID=A0A4Q1AP94_9BACT|nr:matrixin family metalloprotease [Halarcobacter ebronensis]QKF81734.1 zinc-dependent metalloprotease [Halarcobacter ebronensis]RXK04588.1 hypothetical protein CRV07_10560 [Halarcobacter ebronensis]
MKFSLFIFLLTSFAYCSYEKVTIGNIDPYYEHKITKEQLKDIILEIKKSFKEQLNKDIFDYSTNGKPINLVYIPTSKIENLITRNQEQLQRKENLAKRLSEQLASSQKRINSLKDEFKDKKAQMDKKIEIYNSYVNEQNKKKKLSKEEYQTIKEEIDKRKKVLNEHLKVYKNDKKELRKEINFYNANVIKYNRIVLDYNRLSRDIERLNRTNKKVRGQTFGEKKTIKKISFKDGKTREIETNTTVSMNKIEIYGFESLNELKAVLAHEIAHLVGIPHVDSKGSLMNPVLQKNQIDNLYLTKEDIAAFEKYF